MFSRAALCRSFQTSAVRLDTTIFVRNIPWSCKESDLAERFAEHGQVLRCRIVNDKFTGRSRGFAFIDMVDEEAETAIKMMDGTSVMGRNLFVSKSAPPEKPSGFTERVPSSAGASGGRRDRPADPEDF
ncbi:MAG: hypothetical protein SGCHY_004406 [Lobulomycetales sp.]